MHAPPSRPAVIRFAGHGGDEIPALFQRANSDGRASALVLVQEAFGIDAHIAALVERFAGAGFTVIAPDLFAREGRALRREPRIAKDGQLAGWGVPLSRKGKEDSAVPWSVDEIRGAVASLPDRRVLGDLEGALAWLAEQPNVDGDALAAVGFCMGGNHAYQLGCASRRVRCVVDFYGRLVYRELDAAKPIQPIELALNLSVPLLAFFGERDSTIPPEHVERFRRALSQGAKDFEIVTFPEAGHGFFNDTRATFRADEARDAWNRTLAFLRERLELEDAP